LKSNVWRKEEEIIYIYFPDAICAVSRGDLEQGSLNITYSPKPTRGGWMKLVRRLILLPLCIIIGLFGALMILIPNHWPERN